MARGEKREWMMSGFLLVVAIFSVRLCSFTTVQSTLHPFYADSYHFQVIGKYWTQGKVPYVDLWDSKGPFIFFFDAIGYASHHGLVVLQVPSLWVTLLFFREMFQKCMAAWKSVLYCLVMAAMLSLTYEGGNTVEEPLLPFLAASISCIYGWIQRTERGEWRHDPKKAYVYGLTVGVCLFSRATNMLGIGGAVLVIFCALLIHRENKNLFQNLLWGMLGVSTVVVPFSIYFAARGALGDMVYAAFTYNMVYTASSSAAVDTKKLVRFLVGILPAICLFLWGLFLTLRGRARRATGITWMAMALLPLVWLLRSNMYLHYAAVVYPYSALLIVEAHRESKKAPRVLLALFLLAGIAAGGMRYQNQRLALTAVKGAEENGSYALTRAEQMTAETIPKNELSSFTAYNCNPKIYLDLGICPATRFFAFQDWAVHEGGESFRNLFLDDYARADSKWILVQTTEGKDVQIEDILEEDYTCVKSLSISESEEYRLYREKK